jgi:hypothetical protein
MKKTLLKERFQQLAGIKPLYEVGEPEPTKIMAAAFLSHEDYKTIYFGDDQEFRDNEFEYVEAFTVAPYVLIIWNDESIYSHRYESEEEFISNFRDMGYGECDERECDMTEIIEVINDSQPDKDSGDGLALLTSGEVTAQGGENSSTVKPPQDDSSIAGMEDELVEGSCGYSQEAPSGKELNTPGDTQGMEANKRTSDMIKKYLQNEERDLVPTRSDEKPWKVCYKCLGAGGSNWDCVYDGHSPTYHHMCQSLWKCKKECLPKDPNYGMFESGCGK